MAGRCVRHFGRARHRGSANPVAAHRKSGCDGLVDGGRRGAGAVCVGGGRRVVAALMAAALAAALLAHSADRSARRDGRGEADLVGAVGDLRTDRRHRRVRRPHVGPLSSWRWRVVVRRGGPHRDAVASMVGTRCWAVGRHRAPIWSYAPPSSLVEATPMERGRWGISTPGGPACCWWHARWRSPGRGKGIECDCFGAGSG